MVFLLRQDFQIVIIIQKQQQLSAVRVFGPQKSITGQSLLLIGGVLHSADESANSAQDSLQSAYFYLAGLTNGTINIDLGRKTLFQGIYKFSSQATINGILILDANGDTNAQWVFQIGSYLQIATGAIVKLIGGGSAYNVYWLIEGYAVIDSSSTMVGNIVAKNYISLGEGVTLDGRALSVNSYVNLNFNYIASVECRPS